MRVFALFILLITLPALGQIECHLEDFPTSESLNTVGNALANCTIAHPNDYWMCRGLTERNCSLVREQNDYWSCRAITTRNCTLARTNKDYWMCRGLTEKNCTVVTNENYWTCRGITSNNCSIVPPEQYWFCRALGRTFH